MHMYGQFTFLTADWIVKKYLDTFRADPTWSVAGIIHRIRSDLYLEISAQKAWTVKNKALKILAGKEGSQYAKLNAYAVELKKSNPGSTIIYDLQLQVFKRAYICLAACKAGFLAGCRPILSLDGCWLKGRYGGQLLSAVGIDANDCIFPVAYAVVETENTESWRWFLQLLANDIGIENNNAWTFMSDRQKGLVSVLNSLFSGAEHRFCVRHLHQNYFNAKHKGKNLKDHLWMAAMATYTADHEKSMLKLKVLSNAAYEWLNEKPAHEWSKSQFSTRSKCDMLLNNLCECFNKYILDARDKPIVTMLEMIRTKLMRRLQMKRDTMMKYKGLICPKIQKKLDNWKSEAFKYTAIWNGGTQYQVTGPDGQFVINTSTFSCSCRRWDLTGIPCPHACASFRINNIAPETYVDECYNVETYLKCYSYTINPISGYKLWAKSDLPEIIPPEIDPPKPGRPKKARKKHNVELENNIGKTKVSKRGKKMVCSVCHQEGHTKKKHKQNTTAPSIDSISFACSEANISHSRPKLQVKRKRPDRH